MDAENSWFTTLEVRQSHEEVYHNGVRETLVQLRCKYWLIKGSQAVKKVVRRIDDIAFKGASTAELPRYRVTQAEASSTTGADFSGPLYVTKKRKGTEKAYIALFTCATSRMLHLELAPNLTASSFIRCMQRFMARKVVRSRVFSDNAKTFKSREVEKFSRERRVDCTFNLAKAPCWGRIYERMVESAKRCLKKDLKNARLTYEELMTVITEIEAVINSRPLTYVYEEQIQEVITPSHLFVGRRLLTQAEDGSTQDEVSNLTVAEVNTRADYLKKLKQQFWNRWQKEYLQELREHQRIEISKGNEKQAHVGGVVVVYDHMSSRTT